MLALNVIRSKCQTILGDKKTLLKGDFMFTHDDVAQWMFKKLTKEKSLNFYVAVYEIAKNFGNEFIYLNDWEVKCIDKKVLSRFKKLYKGKAVWAGYEKCWIILETLK